MITRRLDTVVTYTVAGAAIERRARFTGLLSERAAAANVRDLLRVEGRGTTGLYVTRVTYTEAAAQ